MGGVASTIIIDNVANRRDRDASQSYCVLERCMDRDNTVRNHAHAALA